MRKRFLSILLVLCMILPLLPAQVFAAEPKVELIKADVNPFSDVKEGQWYYDAVLYALENGLFSGTSESTFSPDGTMTRGMYVTVLGRMVGVDVSQYNNAPAFSDVQANSYYAPYVAWAAEKGVTLGIGDGKFDPEGFVTRQQMASFIVRLFDTYGYTYPEATVTGIPKDFDGVASYAKAAVLKLWACGMLVGDAGYFNPESYCSRAQAATLLMRTDRHLIQTEMKKDPNEKPDEQKPSNPDSGSGSGGSSGGGGSVVRTYTIKFNTMGGAALSDKKLPAGAKLDNLPIPYKMNGIFQGWYTDAEISKPVLATDTISGNMTLYAGYSNAEGVSEQATSPFVSAIDVSASFGIDITDDSASMTSELVKASLAYTCLSNPEFTDIRVLGSNGSFTITGNERWIEGSTNKLELLDERLHFTGQDPTADIYNFTVSKTEVLNLQLKDNIKYLSADSISNITQDGVDVYNLSIPLATVKAGRTSSAKTGTTTGTFTYSSRMRNGETINVGDVVAIYEGTNPVDRGINTSEDNYADEDVAYIIITKVEDDKYIYKNADSTDILFTPDILPVSDAADQNLDDLNTLTVSKSVLDFSDEKYAESGLDATTTIDVGDFIAFYPDGADLGDDAVSVSSYAEITAVTVLDDNYIITYENSSMEYIIAAMDIYDNNDIDGEKLLDDVNVQELEDSIVQQAYNSGFVEEASHYLAVMAMETEGFKKLAGDLAVSTFGVGNKAPYIDNLDPTPHITTKLKHFEGHSGLRAALTLSFDIIVPTGENKIVIHVEGTFEEEVRLTVNVDGGAVWKWAFIFPYIADYRLNSNIDIYNFTGISIEAQVGTFGKDETPDLDEEDDWDNVAMQLKELIEKAEEGKEIVEGIDTMGTSLADKYSAMLENESDWVELFSVNLFEVNSFIDPFHILCYGIEANFVVSANMNASIGLDFYYENAKRYNFSLGLFSKTSKSDTVTLVEEKYEFTFYVMGTVGVRAGLLLEVKVGLFSLKLNSIGLSAEVGAYIRMWGYFYYNLKWTESTGKQSAATGALLMEIGIYLEIKFMAQAFNGYFAYNPTLYENEWPIFTAGKQDNVQGFAYTQDKVPTVEMKKTAYSTVLSDSVFTMSYMDMKDGKIYNKAYNDETDFGITISNPAFSYDPKTNTVTVTPGKELSQSGVMTIVWKKQPLVLSSKAMSRTISLEWEDLEGAYAINFNSNGGNSVKPIVARPGTAINTSTNPTKQGYIFGGWYKDADPNQSYTIPAVMGEADVTLYAKWNPATDTKYTVYHYQQNLANAKQYTLVDTNIMNNGVTDSNIYPSVKSYTGFTSPAPQNLTILPDGSAALSYYYERNTYSLTFSRNGIDENADDVHIYKFGATISAPKLATAGYLFDSWDKEIVVNMPAENLVYTANWIADPNTPYRVEYYLQNTLGEKYNLQDIQYLSGTTATEIDVNSFIKSFDGLNYDRTVILNTDEASPKIDKTGKTIIKLYYNRNKYDVEIYVDGTLLRTDKVLFGATLLELAKPTKAGYIFEGWFSNEAMTTKYQFGHAMTKDTVKLYGKYTPSTDTVYTVQHYVEQLNGDYTYQKSNNDKKGTTDELLTLSTLIDATLIIDGGITYKEAKVGDKVEVTTRILPDGSLIVKLYYQRESHTLTFINGIEEITRTGKFESTINPPTVTKQGYDFAGWSPVVPQTMPAEDAVYTAQWTPATNTAYKVEHYWQNANNDNYELHETAPYTGTTGQTVTAVEKSYNNFILNNTVTGTVKEGIIAPDGKLVLKLYYDRKKFNITFNANGGELKADATQNLRHGATVTTTAPERKGYGFDGWYLDEAYNSRFNGIMPEENITVYAKWNEGEAGYTVLHFVMDTTGNYPTVAIPTDNLTSITGTVLNLSSLKNSAYEVTNGISFAEAKVNNQAVDTATVLSDGTLEIHLYYKRESFRLDWNTNGGMVVSGGTPTSDVYYQAPITAPTVTKSGFKHNGWSPAFTGEMPANGVTYKAQWIEAIYNITYKDVGDNNFSGVHGNNHPTRHTYGATTTLVAPTKANYTFEGWFTDANESGMAITQLEANHLGNVTLYAKWSAKPYNIYYNLNGGSSSENPEKYYYGTSVNLQDPIKVGYTFVGWYSDSAMTTKVGNPVIGASDSGDKSFYAKWKVTTYDIKYEINIVGATNKNPATYTIESNTINLSAAAKDYYRFDGWYEDIGYNDPITSIENGSTGNKTIYGKMTEVGMKITYQLEGGVNNVDNPEYYRVDQGKVYLQEPYREGYDFAGWNLKTVASTTQYDVTSIELSTYPTLLELKAKWTPKNIVITYHDYSSEDVNTILPTTMTVGQSVTLPTRIYSKANGAYRDKQLLGIYRTADFSGDPVTKLDDFMSDTDLYVKWADGSESNPYLLREENDFMRSDSVLKLNASSEKFFKITQDISISYSLNNGTIIINDGILGETFNGTILPGDNYVTFKLTLGQMSPLFKVISGTLRNFHVINTQINAHLDAASSHLSYGLLACETTTSAMIENCYVSATVNVAFVGYSGGILPEDKPFQNCYLGGIVGYNRGTVNNVKSSCTFRAGSSTAENNVSAPGVAGGMFSVGGIAGYSYGGEIRNCEISVYSVRYAMPEYNGYFGGIIGIAANSPRISNCIVKKAYTSYPAISTILCDEYGNTGSSGSVTKSSGVIAGYVYSGTLYGTNLRVIANDGGNFPIIGIINGYATASLTYIYITATNYYPITAEKLFTYPNNYTFNGSIITRAASVYSEDIFPTDKYLTKLDSNNNPYVTNNETTVKDAMNAWVNAQNAINFGKYKLWE